MKKLLIAFLFLAPFFSYGQGYYHAAGIQILSGNQKLVYTTPGLSYSGDIGYGVPSLFYKATYMFNSNSVSFGASAYPAIGAFTSQTGFGLGYTLPINGEVYIGDIEDVCFFLGAGYSIGTIINDNDDLKVSGPNIGIGGQFHFKDNLFGVRGSFTPGLNTPKYPSDWTVEKDKRYMYTIGLYFTFGN